MMLFQLTFRCKVAIIILNSLKRAFFLLAGAFTWQSHTVWLERGQKHMHYIAMPALLQMMPCKNFKLQVTMIRCVLGFLCGN